MKASDSCYECLQRLVHQAAELASSDKAVRARAVECGLKTLREEFSTDRVSIVVATKIHDVIKRVTGNADPYRRMKDREIQIARDLSKAVKIEQDSFRSCLKFAALGNTIDFFRTMDAIMEDMRAEVNFATDDSAVFEVKLGRAGSVLYLADNAGEIFFDLPLIRWIRKRRVSLVYVLKAAPVQDDVTLDDAKRAGLEAELGELITTGTATPGIDFSVASAEFRREFRTVDLVFAKGMGYYESLSELPAEGRVFHCVRAKCRPVADSLGVPRNSYVAMLR